MSCEEFADRVSDYLDDRLPFGERIGMCMHRLVCTHCRNFYRQVREVVEFIEDHGEPAETGPSPEVKAELLEEYRERTADD